MASIPQKLNIENAYQRFKNKILFIFIFFARLINKGHDRSIKARKI